MSNYPDSDWPYTFYFNGEALPRWTAQWHLCQLGQHALYLAYTLKFHRKDLAHDLWTYCDVTVRLDDSMVVVGSIYNK